MSYTKEYKEECFREFLEASIIALKFIVSLKKVDNEYIISKRQVLLQMLEANQIDTNEKMDVINEEFNKVLSANGYDKLS